VCLRQPRQLFRPPAPSRIRIADDINSLLAHTGPLLRLPSYLHRSLAKVDDGTDRILALSRSSNAHIAEVGAVPLPRFTGLPLRCPPLQALDLWLNRSLRQTLTSQVSYSWSFTTVFVLLIQKAKTNYGSRLKR
jgi:hypothetical protein